MTETSGFDEGLDQALLARLRDGDDAAFGPLFESQRERLRRMVAEE